MIFRFLVLSVALVFLTSATWAAGIEPTTPAPAASNISEFNIDKEDVDYFAAALYCDARGIITGAIGTLIGLLISAAGLYIYLLKRSWYGLFFFFAGVAFTGLPGIFNWYYAGVKTAFGEDNDGNWVLGKTSAETTTLEDWCEHIYSGVEKKAAITENRNIKLRDVDAEQGVGVETVTKKGVSDGYYCSKAIESYTLDASGNPVVTMGGEFCLK